MRPSRVQRSLLVLLDQTSVVLFAGVLGVFGTLSPKFLTLANLSNLGVQAASTGIVAIGMTFVLLTAGVDLSVGAIMFVGAAVAGKLAMAGWPVPLALAMMLLAGVVCGCVNGLLVTRLRILAFVATLGTLYLGRGFALWLTETRAMNLPPGFLQVGTARLGWVPVPIVVLAGVLVLAHWVLMRTPFGRQIYAVGYDAEAARRAGVRTDRVLLAVYAICGLCAAVGGVLALAQLGTVSPTFGRNKEFHAIAAAVLGGTSLFGGRGRVFPGTLLGALLMQSVDNGLVILNANEYLYPLVLSGIIFLAVAVDSGRSALLTRLTRRPIRLDTED
jgi:ribose transport system permease protein